MLLQLSIGCTSRPSDDAIAKDIQRKIAENPLTKDAPVSVSAQAGKVTLSGKVKSPEVREKIEQIAREEPGATAVENQTTALPAAVPPPETRPCPRRQRLKRPPRRHRRIHRPKSLRSRL
jgi:hypothetical protein